MPTLLKVDFDDGGKAARRGAILEEMLRRVRALPGIEAAGISDMLPLDRNRSWDLMAKGKPYSKTTNYDAFVYIVTPGYLDAIGMHLRAGTRHQLELTRLPARQSFLSTRRLPAVSGRARTPSDARLRELATV